MAASDILTGCPEHLLARLTDLRHAVTEFAKPYQAGGRVVVPRYELSLGCEEDHSVRVVVRVYKPTDTTRVVAAFPPDIYEDIRAQVEASGLSWDAYFEEVCRG